MRNKKATWSFRAEVKIRAGQPCSLKRHFRGCLRQVIGYLDVLAAGDPERFVWCRWQSVARQARKWNEGGKTYSRTRVFFCLKEARDSGILERATRVRNGCGREGFLVKSHDTLAANTAQELCVLSLPKRDSKRDSAEAKTGLENLKTGLKTGLDSSKNGTENGTAKGTEKDAQATDKKQETANDDEVSCEVLREVLQPLTLSALSREPCKESPAELGKTAPLIPHTSFSDLDMTQNPQLGEDDRTIGKHFNYNFSAMSPESTVEVVSAGLFETDRLAKYLTLSELAECCAEAVRQLKQEPFRGKKSCARVMGRAMELLRETHGLNAPRGWLPVMRKLRETTSDFEEELPPSYAASRAADLAAIEKWVAEEQAEAELAAPAEAVAGLGG